MMFRRALAGTFALVTAVAVVAATARADQEYVVNGHDTFRTANGEMRSETVYRGVQRLTITRSHGSTTYDARVEYDRDGDGGRQHQRASFTATLLPSGQQQDGVTNDPDYLTVLNQPFAVQLDAPTMRDLAHVKRPVPFDFPSPMTGATLHGTLRRLPDATVAGTRAMGVAFEAKGPLHGALPDRPRVQLAGSITMKGTAYYAYANALLVALNATLGIDGTVDDAASKAPISIVYARSIRTSSDQQAARPAPIPRRT